MRLPILFTCSDSRHYFSFVIIFSFLCLSACSPGAQLLNKIPVNSVEVEVLDRDGTPVPGAQLEASNGRKVTTGSNGTARIRFGSVGVHTVTVLADNHMPANFLVTMPTDNNKKITRRLTGEINFSGFNYGSAGMYPMMFNYLFSSYGYALEAVPYEESELTRWKISTGEEPLIMQKAFLKIMDNGQEWWQITLGDEDGEQPEYIAEVLFSNNRNSVLRYREQMEGGEVQEKPVSEGWYSQPAKLTEESMQGAQTKSGVSISTPAGDFTGDLIDFGIVEGTSLQLWKVDTDVPGGVVRYRTTSEGERLYQSEIISHGDNAQTLLNSY